MRKAPPNTTNIISTKNSSNFVGITFGEDISEPQHSHGLSQLVKNLKTGKKTILRSDSESYPIRRELLKSKIGSADESLVAILWDDGTDLAFVLYPKEKLNQMNIKKMNECNYDYKLDEEHMNTLLIRHGPFSNFIEHQTYSYNKGIDKNGNIIPYSSKDISKFIEQTSGIQTSWDKNGFIVRGRGKISRAMIQAFAKAYVTGNLTLGMGIPGDIDNQYYQIPTMCIYSKLKKFYSEDPKLKMKLKESSRQDIEIIEKWEQQSTNLDLTRNLNLDATMSHVEEEIRQSLDKETAIIGDELFIDTQAEFMKKIEDIIQNEKENEWSGISLKM